MKKPNNITINDWKLLTLKYKNLKKIEKKLKKNYPVQYLIGSVNFYGYDINVNKNVLIPRFETETLVEKTIKYIKKSDLENASVIELGTGSGCISIALKKELKNLIITGIDIDKKAIKIAKKNAEQNNAEISFFKKNIFRFQPVQKYDILISNPPYITKKDEIDEAIKYEPQKAIFADDSGINFYKHIISTCKNYLNKKNIIAFEIGCTQGAKLKELSKQYYPNAKIIIEKDLSLKDRYLFIINE